MIVFVCLFAFAHASTVFVDRVAGNNHVGCGAALNASCASIAFAVNQSMPFDTISVSPVAIYGELNITLPHELTFASSVEDTPVKWVRDCVLSRRLRRNRGKCIKFSFFILNRLAATPPVVPPPRFVRSHWTPLSLCSANKTSHN